MNKRIMAVSIFGLLTYSAVGTKPTFLGIAEKESEIDEIMKEYNDVFGIGNIIFLS